MPSPKPTIHGCHLLGSIPGHTTTHSVLTTSALTLPNRLKRFPDGEMGPRTFFTYFQMQLFASRVPELMVDFKMNQPAPQKPFSPHETASGNARIRALELETGYDDAAIESYAVFARLKNEGLIPPGAKFQVCLPTSANVVVGLYHQFRAAAFEVHEKALFRAMRRIQDVIPHGELSIQVDLAIDTALWHGCWETAWFEGDPREFTLRYILRMIGRVEGDVELGVHNCYGSMEEKHFFEPTSLQTVTDRGLALLARASHKIAYFHCPVPLSAMEYLPEYLAPLAELYPALEAHDCELYLGLVHLDDVDSTRKMIEEAGKLAPAFGVATECGMGRGSPQRAEETMKLMAEVSDPLK